MEDVNKTKTYPIRPNNYRPTIVRNTFVNAVWSPVHIAHGTTYIEEALPIIVF